MVKKQINTKNKILLEIGTEPLPANFIPKALWQLKENCKNILSDNNIVSGEIEVYGTYRRLVLLVKNVEDLQKSHRIEIKGPSKEIAFDEDGKPTKAYFGFLKKTGSKESDIEIRKKGQNEYLYALKVEPARKVSLLLPKILKNIINSISCPKNMRWGKEYQFIRPIRWILALWDDKIIKFELAGIASSNITYGHQVLKPKPFKVQGISGYFKVLENNYVVLDPDRRKERIEKEFNRIAKLKGSCISCDDELLREVSNLTEYPDFLIGSFNKKFLSLPDEVLKISLKNGQKLFALQDKKEKILPLFLAVIDNKPSSSVKRKICANYESILEAKLKDSIFFLEQDTQESLIKKVAALKEIIFQRDLGSVLEKVERLKVLSGYISAKVKLSDDKKADVERCALLCKADLTTHMVQEFPSLQGTIGYKYALASGENKLVCRGILEHYLPKFQDDNLPKTITGSIVALADKLDTLTSCLSIGLVPTGSFDPYALRRSAHGLVRIILERKLSLSLEELLNKNLSLLKDKARIENEVVKKQVKEFLRQRFRQIVSQKTSKLDIIEAVLCANYDDFVDVQDRIEQLDKISKSKKFFESCKVVERTSNILKKAPEHLPSVNPKLFRETLEQKLMNIYNESRKNIEDLINKKEYKIATENYADAFFKPIHVFFDKVLVNVDNVKIRNNRLALMQSINRLYTERIADLSKVNF